MFGGRTITATDCAVAGGIAEIGDRALAKVPPALAAAVLDHAQAMIEDAVDGMKTEAGDVTLIAVGGGAFLVPDRLAGISEVDPAPLGARTSTSPTLRASGTARLE